MSALPSFLFRKWYLDCVRQSGETVIWYAAQLLWRGLSVHYANVLTLSPDIQPQSCTVFRRFPEPKMEGESVIWQPPFSSGNIEWRREDPAISEQLYTADEGSVEWDCLMPRANVYGGGFSGTGYVETLRLTIPPWKLPVETLRWGRAHCGKFCIVWIQWLGNHPRADVWINGLSDKDATIDGDQIIWNNGRTLQLTPAQAIREGFVISTVLRESPLLNGILPSKIANLHEAKFLSRAHYITASEEYEGWAIHETVRF